MKRWLAAALLAWAPAVAAQWAELSFVDPGLSWRTLETAHFAVHFAERHRSAARSVAGAAERLLPGISTLLRWKPSGRIHVVVLDSADFANGLASPLPFNYTMLFLSPPDEGELLQNQNWLDLVLSHELFHLVHLDMARGAPLGLRSVFGRLPFLFPNAFQPGWIVEGLAVHAESNFDKRYGRLGQAAFEGMMRAEASRGFRSLSEVNAGGRGFPLNREYLYGGYFFLFLKERYGEKALASFVENYSDNVVPFRVHSNPVVGTGRTMDRLWDEYLDWLTMRFNQAPSAREGDVLAAAWTLTAPALAADGTRWYVSGDGYTRPRLMRQRPGGEPQALREVEQDARIAAAPGGALVLAEPEICGNYNYYYDLRSVAADGRHKRLTTCGRYRHAALLDDGRVIGASVGGGEAQIVVINGEVLYRASAGESITGLAARDALVVFTTSRHGRWSVMALHDGKAEVLVADAAVKHSPRIGAAGEIFFVADYGNTYNVWSVRGSRLARWTQARHGIKEMSAPQGGEILLTTIEPEGDVLRLYRLPEEPLELRPAESGAAEVPADARSVDAPDRPYTPWRSLLPRSWFPAVELAEGAVKIGATTFGQDALGLHQYVLTAQYEVTQRELLGNASYVYDGRHLFFVDRGMRVRETVEDDIELYSVDETAQWVSTWRHLRLNRRFFWGGGGALERETLYRRGVQAAEDQDERVLGLVAGVDSRRSQWLSEGPSQGMQLRLFAEKSYGFYTGQVYRADWRAHIPAGRTVLGVRWNEGWGETEAEPFQLGGNHSDPALVLPILNQRDFPLRGYGSGEPTLNGHRARLVTVEWRVPLKDVDRHAMVPPIGLNRVAANLFLDVGDAWARGADADYHRGYGVELRSEVRLGYLLPLDLRLGLAKGRDEGGRSAAYLRLGRSF